ncbi:MAG TPA: roadblock/LC7 domain-containing protein [Blastocatellia bacterium]|nr:roadblock/LC7 domain-containing protein [Blastocatellia bacterium]
MPFKALLKELVASAQGASGAILLEADGEAVQWYAEREEDRLRLRAAYVVMVLESCRSVAARADLGNMGCTILQYDGASFVGQEVEGGYFLVLELDPSANVGQALYRLQPTMDKLRRVLEA